MSVMLESRMLRDFLHRLVDNLINDIESVGTSAARPGGIVCPPDPSTKPRITLEPPTKKTPATKPMLHQYPDVTISCRRSCGALEIAVNLAAEIGQRLGLKPHGKATLDLHRGKLRVRRAEKVGRAVYSGGATGRVFFSVWADPYGVTEKHAPESCTFQYDLEDALLIDPPAWLKPTAVRPQKPKANPPATCTKLRGTNPTIKCAACQKASATVECNRCPTLLCDECWESHVRTHWHTAVTSRAPAGHAADLGK